MGLIDFLNVLLRLNIPLFCVLMFMKGQNCCCHPGSRGTVSGLRGKLACSGGLLTSPAVRLPEHSSDSGGSLPSGISMQKGMEGNLTVFIICVPSLDFQTLGML